MNKKQYHNVIHWTLKQDESVRNSDALTAVRAIFKNMGVALPNGNCQEINEVLATGKYMNWKPCDYDEVQKLANKGVAVVGISDSDIVVIDTAVSAEENLQTTETASAFARTTDALTSSEVSAMSFYSYNSANATTTESGGGSVTMPLRKAIVIVPGITCSSLQNSNGNKVWLL